MPKLYSFDVDHTLWISNGPITPTMLLELRQEGHILGLCGNFAAVTLQVEGWHNVFSFVNAGHATKDPFLIGLRTFVKADEYIHVGNTGVIPGQSDDLGAAQRSGYRFISENAFANGER